MGTYELRTLGAVSLRERNGGELLSVRSQPKRLALLIYLAVEAPGRFVRRDKLTGLLWPDSDRQHARGNLRKAIPTVRSAFSVSV